MSRAMRRVVTTLFNQQNKQIAQYELWSNQKRKWTGDEKLKTWFQAFNGNPEELSNKLKELFPQLIGCKITFLREIGHMETRDFIVQKTDNTELEIN